MLCLPWGGLFVNRLYVWTSAHLQGLPLLPLWAPLRVIANVLADKQRRKVKKHAWSRGILPLIQRCSLNFISLRLRRPSSFLTFFLLSLSQLPIYCTLVRIFVCVRLFWLYLFVHVCLLLFVRMSTFVLRVSRSSFVTEAPPSTAVFEIKPKAVVCGFCCLPSPVFQALRESRVKLKGTDVVASYKVLVLLVLVPLFNLIYGFLFGILFLK